MDRRSILFAWVSIVVMCAFALSQGIASEEQYQAALTSVRGGKIDQALKILEDLVHKHPETLRYQYDYLQVLGLAGMDAKVLAVAADLDVEQSPPYVLEAAARSARNLKKYTLSRRFYRFAADRAPDRPEPRIGLALLSVDQGHPQQAIKHLFALAEKYPNNLDVLSALAYAYETEGNHFEALKYTQEAYTVRPDNADLFRQYIMAINRIGANGIALEKAEQHAGLLSPEAWARLEWDRAAFLIRWGEIPTKTETLRFLETDKAIRKLGVNEEYIKRIPSEATTWKHLAEFDLVVALQDRREMKKVLGYARRFEQQNVDLPSYVMAAIGDAYLYLEKPSQARDWYLKTLKKDPKMFYVELALFYAYLENEQHGKAVQLIDGMNKRQPMVRKNWFPGGDRSIAKGNPRKTLTARTAALARAYGNNLQDAESLFKKLTNRAPYNTEIRSELADVYYWRGWPRASQKQIDQALNLDPKNLNARVGRARNELELMQYRDAEQSTSKLVDLYPEQKDVQLQNLLWQIHNERELRLEVNGGTSSGNVQGSDTLTFDGHLYSAPINYNYRVFLHSLWNRTDFPEGIGKLSHHGIGLEYTRPNLNLTVEVHDNEFSQNRVGGSLFAGVDLDDVWNLSGSFDSFSGQTPYRALKNDIYARSIDFTISHRANESRISDVTGSFLDFTDGNKRYSLAASHLEWWVTTPHYILNTTISASYSHNDKTFAPYFNPKNDTSIEITFDNDWLTYRHYDTTFYQRLALTGGGYWQDGFGTGPVGAILYEHRWATNYRIELKYGAALSNRLYDGDRETWLNYFMTLNWRF